MAVLKVGSARLDENGRISGGKVGDQTGKEVSIQNYYIHSKGWYILRPKDVEMAIAMAEAMIRACNNNNIGYDQNNRAGVLKYGTSTTTKTEADCGTLVRQCIKEASGVDVGEFYTGNEASVLEKSGLFEERVAVTSSTILYNGDVLVTRTKGHTVVVVSGRPRTKADLLEVDGEWGVDTTTKSQKVLDCKVVDGIVSNQIARLRRYIPNALYSSWEFEEEREDYKKGSALIKAIQELVGAEQDGHCGEETVTKMQEFLAAKGLYSGRIDGIMGVNTVKGWQMYINSCSQAA